MSPNSPFSVFRSSSASPNPQVGLTRLQQPSSEVPDPLQERSATDALGLLSSHFVNHVAGVLMPFNHEDNLWQTSIPQAVLRSGDLELRSAEQRSLYNGVLALAATHLAKKGVANKEEMEDKANKHYGIATSELVTSIGTGNRDYGTFLAAVLTMMMVEVSHILFKNFEHSFDSTQVFRGHSGSWRTHLHGAWDFIRTQSLPAPWELDRLSLGSTHAWYTSAILCESSILCIEPSPREAGSGTNKRFEQALLRGMADCVTLGLTLGASPTIMRGITEIQRLRSLLQTNAITVEDLEQKSEDIRSRLDQVDPFGAEWPLPDTDSAKRFAEHHLYAFKHAALIYLARETQDILPSMLRGHVNEIYRNVEAYFESGGQNFAIWPVFIASTEAYDETHIAAARNWLEVRL